MHSYLSYLRDRLVAARQLLALSGSIFVQIGDQNLHVVRSVMDEIFGADNFCSQIAFKKTSGATSELLAGVTDYILWYALDRSKVKYRSLYWSKIRPEDRQQYSWIRDADGHFRPLRPDEDGDALPRLRHSPLTSQRPPGDFPVVFGDREYRPKTGYWKTNQEGMEKLICADRLVALGNTLEYVR